VGEDVDFSVARDNGGDGVLCGIEAVERGGKREEVGMVEVGLLDVGRKADYGCSGGEQGLGDVGAEAARGSGDLGRFCQSYIRCDLALNSGCWLVGLQNYARIPGGRYLAQLHIE
jgi:hypothetical protein